MIRSLVGMDLTSILASIIGVILAMSVHEMAHALVSYWLGDPTAKLRGRLSLNPFHHVDWTGLLCLLFFGFGWARPVPIDSRYYKDERTGIIWTSFAGPAANFLLGFAAVFLYYAVLIFAPYAFLGNWLGQFLLSVLSSIAVMSLGFGIFNLIPIPPLDGAKIFWAFLPDKEYDKWMNGTPWMSLVLILLIATGILSGPLSMMRSTLIQWMSDVSLWLLQLF